MNFSMIRYTVGLVIIFEGIFLSLPGFVGLITRKNRANPFSCNYAVVFYDWVCGCAQKAGKNFLLCKRRIYNSCSKLDCFEFFWCFAVCVKWRYSIFAGCIV